MGGKGSGPSPYTRAAARARRERVLALVAEGHSIASACRAVGVTVKHVYNVWPKAHPDFYRRLKQARLAADDPTLSGADFRKFRSLYFERDTPYHHQQIIEAVTDAAPDSVTMILAPPEAAKTQLLVDLMCFRLGENPNDRICLLSEGQHLARKIVGQVQRRMTDRADFAGYIEAYGPFTYTPADRKRGETHDRDVRRPWTADYFTVLGARHDEKDYSLEAKGAGSRIYGDRYDLILADDIQSLGPTGMSFDSSKLLGWLRQVVMSRLERGSGRLVIVGSRQGPGDIYETMLESDMVHELVQIPALDADIPVEEHFSVIRTKKGPEITLKEGCKATSYWPEFWSLRDLAVKRHAVGEDAWARAYMQTAGDPAKVTFTEDAIRNCLDAGRTAGPFTDLVDGQTAFGLDPALGGWVGLVGAVATYEKLYVTDIENVAKLARTEELIAIVERHALLHRPSIGIVERDGWGKGIGNDDRLNLLAGRMGFTIVPHKTAGNKADPGLGVASMASSFMLGEISIPYGDDRSRMVMDPLVTELRRWRTDERGRPLSGRLLRQDLVMALWFVWRWWRIERDTWTIPITPLWRPSWMREAG